MTAAQRVLIQITIALYRALSSEVAHRFRARARALVAEGPRNDAVELAAQLQLELDNAPSPATLRAFWERIGALQRGVLWLSAPDANFDRFGYSPHLPSPPLDQGMRELVALSTAAQAFQVVSGAITYETVQKDSAENERALKREASFDLKQPANTLFAMLAGALVGAAALFTEGWALPGATAAGLGTALVTQLALTWTMTRSRKQSVSTEYRFLRDRSVETLDRELPLVIERIREAGLAPVFLVDELDKIDGLETSMAQLVQRLKTLSS